MAAMHAVILSIGDELVLGQTVDTNSAYLSAQLVSRGIMTRYHQTVADDVDAIARAIVQACDAGDLVIITGGLGPTDDDLTRAALAQAMSEPLVEDAQSLAQIEAFFAKLQRPMPARNKVQALRPASARSIPNSNGTAPGIQAQLRGARVFVTPGVPRELFPMFEGQIAPQLPAASGGVILTRTIHTFGMGESALAQKLGELMARDRNPKVGTTVAGGVVSARVRSEFPEPRASQEMQATCDRVERALGPIVYGRDKDTLQQTLVSLLRERRLTLATAESCTAGLLGATLTEVPGSSEVYRGGWIVYANAMKTSQLGVDPRQLERFGAVSAEVALDLAEQALRRSDADLSIAVTGIAGPDGGSPDKPVGTVFYGLSFRSDPRRRSAVLARFPGDRFTVRDRAAKTAMQLLRFAVLGVPATTIAWCEPTSASRQG